MAAVDVHGYVADIKVHAAEHGFHIHDERHFVETYSMRQMWEVDLHPEEGCNGPIDLHLSVELEPRLLLAFEDALSEIDLDDPAPEGFEIPLRFVWGLPALKRAPNLLVLATEVAGIGGPNFPLEVSAIDSFAAVTDSPERRVGVTAKTKISLGKVIDGEEMLCETLESAIAVSRWLLERLDGWDPVPEPHHH